MSADHDEPTSKYTGNPEDDRFTKLDGAEYDRIAGLLDDKVRSHLESGQSPASAWTSEPR